MWGTLQGGNGTQHLWEMTAGLGIGVLAVGWLVVYLLRRFFQSTKEEHKGKIRASAPRTENPSAFMAASMQGVIQQLREQEKELERLHKIERERAEQTERLSEEVTRNMPAGLVVVNATGIISSSNPAAEQALGIRGLGFRRYSEALGQNSALTQLVAECLETGRIFRREEVEYVPPAGDTRHLGVTISPIRRSEGKISGVICLLTDLTELAALQQRMQLKENLAVLGELSAGIAHEFKNRLAPLKGFAQQHNLASIEDLKALGPLKLGDYAAEETRYAGFVGLQQAYGLTNLQFVPLAAGAPIFAALDSNQVQVGDAFSTDPQLATGKYAVLKDPKNIFGFQHVALIIKSSLLQQLGPEFQKLYEAVNKLLTADAMQALNKAVSINKQTPTSVAHSFLAANHMV